jgi:uncharacterized protein
MVRVFADAVYWIALLNGRDALHQKTVEVSNVYQPRQIVTSEMVLAELLNACCDSENPLRPRTANYVSLLRKRSEIAIYPQTSQLFDRAFKRYQERSDKGWSLTDCASFVIMQEHQLTAALTQDRHFVQAGFDPLLR